MPAAPRGLGGPLRGTKTSSPPPSPNGCWWSGEATFAGMGSKEDEAP
jgi:hypothetical protein